jgi:oxalate decarboxylase/phosphoglucose isomerase-like protein (cupin superfamily)
MVDVEFIEIAAEIHRGERGFSLFPWQDRVRDPREVLRTGHLVSIRPGQTRGNHLHPGHEEWLYLFHGKGLLVWEKEGHIQEEMVTGGHTLIRIPPGVAHALTNPGPEILYLLAWRQPVGRSATGPETVAKPITEFE